MRVTRRHLRLTGFGLAAFLGAFIVTADETAIDTQVGTAGVAVGDDTARAVERPGVELSESTVSTVHRTPLKGRQDDCR